MHAMSPEYLAHVAEADRLEAEFVRAFAVVPMKWSGHNLSRMLRATGERPGRVEEIRDALGRLGLHHASWSHWRWIDQGGVFDHGRMWGRAGVPLMLVGHPYDVTAEERSLLGDLARFPTLRASVDDRPSHYGFGTHHVRIALAEPRRPFSPPPSTAKTRAAAREARKAFREELTP